MFNLLVVIDIPAPYRIDVFQIISRHFNITVFAEKKQDAHRDEKWLSKPGLDYEILEDNPAAQKRWMKALINIRQYDGVVVYNNSLKFSILTELACIINKIPCFINCDGCFQIETKNPFKYWIKHFLISKASVCFASGSSGKKYFTYYGAALEKIVQHSFTSLHEEDIEQDVPTQEVKQQLKRELGLSDKRVVISIGRFIPVKGFDVLIEASKDFPEDCSTYIIGEEAPEEFLAYRKQTGADNIHFIGYKDKHELKKYYRAADLFVLMSRGDTWGLVINEAMANGLPVITTKMCVAGVELIENGTNGYVIPVDDKEQLILCVRKILDHPKLMKKMQENNIGKMQENTVSQIAGKHIWAMEQTLRITEKAAAPSDNLR